MQPVTLTLMFSATAEQLFCAWTDPALASKWLFKDDATFIERVEMDVAVGGRFLIVARSRDTTIEYCGNYLLVEKPHLLSFTLEAPKLFAGESEVHLEFRQLDEETEFRLQQSGGQCSDRGGPLAPHIHRACQGPARGADPPAVLTRR